VNPKTGSDVRLTRLHRRAPFHLSDDQLPVHRVFKADIDPKIMPSKYVFGQIDLSRLLALEEFTKSSLLSEEVSDVSLKAAI
jgi:hypothetical protein